MIHSFPFYIADWRDSSARIEFSTGEKLLYLELLFWCWKDGDLPTSEEALLTISGMREKEFRAAWQKVQAQFFLQDERYHHHKVDDRRPSLLEWHETRREAGKRGGLAKAHAVAYARKSVAHAKAHALPGALAKSYPSSSSSSSSESGEAIENLVVAETPPLIDADVQSILTQAAAEMAPKLGQPDGKLTQRVKAAIGADEPGLIWLAGFMKAKMRVSGSQPKGWGWFGDVIEAEAAQARKRGEL